MRKILRPYLFISLCGVLAFAPVSFMLRSLKNDILALEYPINYFISQCIRNGEIPLWFNTWGMGFPLQSNLTWGIYSTPQILFSSIFDYNIYILHIEFLFFILLSGFSMYYLLKRFIVKDSGISQLLAIGYMLSGFMVGSSQWLLYITAAAFIPLLIASLLNLLQFPSFKNAIQLAICYTIMFTSVYAAFNIITTYTIIIFTVIWLWSYGKESLSVRLRYLIISCLLTILLCFPCLYFTLELLNQLDRGASITADTAFFNSNYLHPGALSSMLFPFSSVRMGYMNTEGTMLNTYTGLFLLLLLPLSIKSCVQKLNRPALLLAFTALFFLVISWGDITPVRKALNILPGFSHFRNPAIFRLYFILSLVLFAGFVLKERKFENLTTDKLFKNMLWLLCQTSIAVLLANIFKPNPLPDFSLTGLIKNINFSQALLISASVQLLIIVLLLYFIYKKSWQPAKLVFAFDLVINTLICTPFFSVSSYTIPEVRTILKSEKGFPAQQQSPAEVTASTTDMKGNKWHNVNVFSKKVAAIQSYPGPLVLKMKYPAQQLPKTSTNGLFYFNDTDSAKYTITTEKQRPNYVRTKIYSTSGGTLSLFQNYYPGWEVFVNGKSAIINQDTEAGISVIVPPGSNNIEFRYNRKTVWITALLLHIIVIIFGVVKLRDIIKTTRVRSSYLS